MTAPRTRRGKPVGARPEVAEMVDDAFAERTRIAQSKAGPASLPSDAFTGGGETITKAEWERRHAETYGEQSE